MGGWLAVFNDPKLLELLEKKKSTTSNAEGSRRSSDLDTKMFEVNTLTHKSIQSLIHLLYQNESVCLNQ